MSQEAVRQTTSPADLFEAAQAVARTGRRRTVHVNGKVLTIVLHEAPPPVTPAQRRRPRRQNAFLAASGSLPPLDPPRDFNEMTEIAAEEAALAAAREGLEPHDCP